MNYLVENNRIKVMIQVGIAILSLFFDQCENIDKYYRPNLPEKLCTIGIIDADDTTSFISFEKSFQPENPEEAKDLLSNLTFNISTSSEDLFNYQNSTTTNNPIRIKLPENIQYKTNEKYYLRAKENNSQDISAEIVVPSPPTNLKLISVDKETTDLAIPQECTYLTYIKTAVITISFNTDILEKQYFALLTKGSGFSYFSSLPPPVISYFDFTIRDSNVPGFFAPMHGLKMDHWFCENGQTHLLNSHVFPYFIDGEKIPEGKCKITLSFSFQNTYSTIDILRSIQIKLLSIPEELYLFEKSLYTYSKIQNDPFAEPVYLNGNIKGGNGVFAICRSANISYVFPFPPAF